VCRREAVSRSFSARLAPLASAVRASRRGAFDITSRLTFHLVSHRKSQVSLEHQQLSAWSPRAIMMVTSVLAAMSMVLVLLIVLVGLGLLRGFGTRWAGYALVSPAEEPPVSPPPMAESDTDDEQCAKRRRVQLQPLLDGRRFWNNELNASILGACGRATYGGNYVCLATGLHVSNFQLDHTATVDRLQRIVDGTLPRASILAAPWRGVEPRTLAGVLRGAGRAGGG
jgi:hypothetical protein